MAQGLLTNRYLSGDIPEGSRAAKPSGFLKATDLTAERLSQITQLNTMAQARGQSLAQMAIAWVLRHPGMTSALIGASSVPQLEDNIAALNNLSFSVEELSQIDEIAAI